MATVTASIWLAMKARVQTLDLPLVFPGETAPADQHIRVSQISGEPINDDLNGAKPILPRTLQLVLHTPITAAGVAYAATQERAGQIAAHFPLGHAGQMQSGGVRVVVTEPPHVLEGMRDENWWITPVRIRCTIHQ